MKQKRFAGNLASLYTYENARSNDGSKIAGNRQKIPNAELRFMHRSTAVYFSVQPTTFWKLATKRHTMIRVRYESCDYGLQFARSFYTGCVRHCNRTRSVWSEFLAFFVSYRIVSVLKTQAWSLYVHIFITYFNTTSNQFLTQTSVSGSGNITSKEIHFLITPKSIYGKLFLKLLTELELTTCTDKLFHIFIILWVTYLRVSYLQKFLTNLKLLPLVTESWHIGKTVFRSIGVFLRRVRHCITDRRDHAPNARTPDCEHFER